LPLSTCRLLTTTVQREREKFIIRQPPIDEKDYYDGENSWISDGLPSSSRKRRTGNGRGEGVSKAATNYFVVIIIGRETTP